MRHFVRMSAVSRCAWLLAVTLSLHETRAHEVTGKSTSNGSPERLLVLQDGGVLAGRIEREGDRFIVSRAGGQMQISAANVLFECGSLDEACERRRQQITRPTADAHLALAEWCLRYDLVEQARRELADAKSLDARHPRVALLDRRLAQAIQKARAPAASADAAAINREPPGLPRRDKPAGSPSNAFTEVPADVVERFTRKVQPVLVNNCTTSGCHQPGGAQSFQLDRALLHGLANRRSTMNNLTATLALVDRQRPQLSPLLTVPRRAHGGMDDPIFGPRQEQAFNHLVEWVALVTRPDQIEQPAQQTTTTQSDSETNSNVAPADHEDDATAFAPARPQLRFGAHMERWQPRDPFDPEIFNRRHRAGRPVAASDAQATEIP